MSSLLQFVAIGGFVIAFLGIALVVSSVSRGRSAGAGVGLTVIGILVAVLFLVFSQGLLVVSATEKAVIYNALTGTVETPRGAGISVIIPGVQQAFMYPINNQTYFMTDDPTDGNRAGQDAIRAKSVEGQDVRVNAILTYQIDDTPAALNQLHLDWSNSSGGYIDGLVRPALNNVVQQITSTYTAEDIYGAGRSKLEAEILTKLTESLKADGIDVEAFRILELAFNDEFSQAIEKKEIANQDLQRAQTEAEQARTVAKGEADAQIESARGQAESVRIQAEAEADALRLISEQIAANPNLIQYHYIDQLGDNVRIVMVPSNSPFLFDASTLTNLGSDFTAPEPSIEATPTPGN